MATQLFLRDDVVTDWQDARFTAINAGGQSTRTRFLLATTRGNAAVTKTMNTQQGVFGEVELLDASNRRVAWISSPLSADVTISGTLTWNIWGLESSMSANACHYGHVWRLDKTGAATLVSLSNDNAELGTSNVANNWTATPTSTAFQKGDRIMVAIGFGNAPGVTMASGFTVNTVYDGPTAAASGDTYITFNETFGFMTTTPAGSKFYFRDTTEATATGDPDFLSKELTAGRGASATSKRAVVMGGTSQGSVSDPTGQFVGDTTPSDTGWMLPVTATNVDTVSGGNWVNPNNVLTDNGAVASVTTQAIGQHDELHFTWPSLSSVIGRIIGVAVRIEARQISATGFDTLRFSTPVGFGQMGTGTLTTTLTLFTDDRPLGSNGALGAAVRSSYDCYFHDDGTGSQGFTTEVDYLEHKLYYVPLYEWFTPPLQAFTLSGLVKARLRGARASGFASPDGSLGFEVAVTDGDGTNAVVYGWGFSVTDTTSTEATLECIAAGDDIAVTNGQRIRIRVGACAVFDDHYGNGNSNTDFFYDGPTADAGGDSWIQLTETVTESAGPAGGILPARGTDRDRYRTAHR